MKRKITNGKYRLIANELKRWTDEGLVSDEQRTKILASYEVTRNMTAVLAFIGATMIGLGIISVVAANWDDIPGSLKVAAAIAAYAACIAAACRCEMKKTFWIADLLVFLSGFLFLGGMAVIAQVFHIGGEAYTLLLTWLIGYTPSLFIVRRLHVFVLTEILAAIYLNMFFFDSPNGAMTSHIAPSLVVLLLTCAAYLFLHDERRKERKEQSAAKKFFCGGPTRAVFYNNFLIVNYIACMFASSWDYGDNAVVPFLCTIVAFGAALNALSRKLESAELEAQGLLFAGVAGLLLTVSFVWKNFGGYDRYNATTPAVAASLLLGAFLVYKIMKSRETSGLATTLFCYLLLRWYFDMFYSFMSKSLFFISGGLIMIGMAYGYRKCHKAYTAPLGAKGENDEADRS